MNYTKLPARKLRAELKREIASWRSLPRGSSCGGLAVSDRLYRIQQELSRRNLPFEPFYTEINMLG
jgi:hypothetical protein